VRFQETQLTILSLVLTTDVLGQSDGLFVQSVVDLSFGRLVPDDAAVGDDDDVSF
jgi:hypothetical protein